MVATVLKPLAVFCSHSQSQQDIRTVRNLGDAWRTLAEQPPSETDQNATIIDTTFDLRLAIFPADKEADAEAISVLITTQDVPPSSPPAGIPRHYRIFPDYGTDFIWRQPDDLREDEVSHLNADEALAGYPPSVLEFYDAWVEVYTQGFKTRCEQAHDYHASVFATASEEVAWNVAGYLLAWRIAIDPQVGSLEYGVGNSKYLLERGKETSLTMEFLNDQNRILAKGEPTN